MARSLHSRIFRKLMQVPYFESAFNRFYETCVYGRYVFYRNIRRNPVSKRMLETQNPRLTESQLKVVDELKSRGIAFVHFNDLFADGELWNRLAKEFDSFVASDTVKKAVQAYRTKSKNAAGKPYLARRYAYPNTPTLSLNDPWLQLGLDARILNVVNSYMGLWSKLNYVDQWYTTPLDEERPATASQLWHRDPEDERIVKVFLYFSEVDEEAGPLEYVPGSCSGGRHSNIWQLPRYKLLNTAERPSQQAYPPQKESESYFKNLETVTCNGSSGTFVFCDTTGFHRGGYATKRARLLAHWAYLTPASMWPRRLVVDWKHSQSKLSEAAAFALR